MILLYPYFLFLLLVPFIFYFFSKKMEQNTAWAKVCDAHLLPYLTIRILGSGHRIYSYLMLFCWSVACICLAGPAIEQKVPTSNVQSALVVVVDMSPAMQGEVIEQTIRKLYDLASYKKDSSLGLVLADAQAYVAMPISLDKGIFKNIIPHLKEDVMPKAGQNYKAAINKAVQLLQQSGFKKGQILFLTAGVDDVLEFSKALQDLPYPVSVIGVGNKQEKTPFLLSNGMFWGGSEPVLVSLSGLKEVLKDRYMDATLDDSDLKFLLKTDNLESIENTDQMSMQYQNLGVYGIVFLLPFVAFVFRKGLLFVFMMSVFASSAQAGFWWRTEQEIYQTQMQGVAHFNLGQYDKAKAAFESISEKNIDALYNLGNTFAYMGQFDKAIQTYEKLLSIDPAYADARHNLEILKKQMPPQSQQAQGTDKNEKQSQSQGKQASQSQEEKNQANQQQSQDNQNAGAEKQDVPNNQKSASENNDLENEQQDTLHSEKKDEVSTNKEKSQDDKADKQSSKINEDKKNQSSEKQSVESIFVPDPQMEKQKGDAMGQVITPQQQKEKEWLDKVQIDAGRLLRYRLRRQYQE